jgi:hypothetical protein
MPYTAMSAEWEMVQKLEDSNVEIAYKFEPRSDCEDVQRRLLNAERHDVNVRVVKFSFVCRDESTQSRDDTYVRIGHGETLYQSYTSVCCGKGGVKNLWESSRVDKAGSDDRWPTTPSSTFVDSIKCVRKRDDCQNATMTMHSAKFRTANNECKAAFNRCMWRREDLGIH